MTRKVFYSFHYKPDNWRAATVRNIGTVAGNAPVSDNDWEKITCGGDAAIKKWIAEQMTGRSCAVVLIGSNTAGRKWINHEIIHAWDNGKGVVGIHINKLKNSKGETADKGSNPFDKIRLGSTGKKLSSVVNTYTPGGTTSKDAYAWIEKHLENAVEEAIEIRNKN